MKNYNTVQLLNGRWTLFSKFTGWAAYSLMQKWIV